MKLLISSGTPASPSKSSTIPLAELKIPLKSKFTFSLCPPSSGFHFSVCGQIFSGLHSRKSKIDIAKSIISVVKLITFPSSEETFPRIPLINEVICPKISPINCEIKLSSKH